MTENNEFYTHLQGILKKAKLLTKEPDGEWDLESQQAWLRYAGKNRLPITNMPDSSSVGEDIRKSLEPAPPPPVLEPAPPPPILFEAPKEDVSFSGSRLHRKAKRSHLESETISEGEEPRTSTEEPEQKGASRTDRYRRS